MIRLTLLFACLFFLAQSVVHAETKATFNFDQYSLSQAAKDVTIKILKKNYLADDTFINDESVFSLNLKQVTFPELENALIATIKRRGYEVDADDKLISIYKEPNNNFIGGLKPLQNQPTISQQTNPLLTESTAEHIEKNLFFYRLKNRDTAYVKQLLKPMFPDNAFSFDLKDGATTLDAFTFLGTPDQITKMSEVLNALDSPSEQVQISAILYQVSNVKRKQSALTIALNLLKGAVNIAVPETLLGNLVQLSTKDVKVAYSALNNDNRFNVISSPSILVKDRERGLINVGEEVPILAEVIPQNNGQNLQSVEYIQTGVILDITPKITRNVTELSINHQLSNAVVNDTGVRGTPKIIKREFSTVVNAKENDIILIGGLSERRFNKTRSYQPLIPAFGSKSSENNTSDLLLMLHVKKLQRI